jgi:hypothetical protein
MGAASIQYGSGPTSFNFKRGPRDFIAEDSARRHDNLSTSGFRESVFESNDILIAFTMPGILINDDYTDWKNFYAWGLAGWSFIFAPNLAVTAAAAPWSGGTFEFNCLIEDVGFKPKRVGLGRYSLDCKFRVVPDSYRPANSGMIMDAFMGYPPA